ncbi:hypothetical protein NHJ13051_006719 [Beauveria bassiana]
MPVDKSGALMIVADDQDSWMQAYQALGRGGRVIRHKKLPSKPSKSFRFLAWSAGMPSKSTYLRKTSDVLPENTWYDGTHMRYQESNPRFRWLARGRHSRGDDDDDDDDCCGGGGAHASGGTCCADCANHSLPWGGQPPLVPLAPLAGYPQPEYLQAGYYPQPEYLQAGYPQPEYAQVEYANPYDSCGQYMPASQPCQEVQWAQPGPARPAPYDRRGRRFTPMASPPPNDESNNWIWRDGPIGPVRYSRQLAMPICDESGMSPGVEQYRCG